MLKQKLQEELRMSMLAKNKLRTSVLRMILSAVNYYEIKKEGTGYEASDEDVLSVIQKEVKQRHDSIDQFKNGGRQDLVDKETEELDILKEYLPKQMSEEELKKLVTETIKQENANSIQDFGRVMGALMAKIKGKANGSLVSQIVKQQLSSS